MAVARNHIVRVEEVSPVATPGQLSVRFGEDRILGSSPDLNSGKDNVNNAEAVSLNPNSERISAGTPDSGTADHEEDIEGSLADEAADMVYPLPEGWPKLPQLFQRRSWNFTTAVSPSVNKVTSHLELLQNVLDEWFQEAQSEIISRASSHVAMQHHGSRVSSAHSTSTNNDKASSISTSGSMRKQLRFIPSTTSSDSPMTSARSGSTAGIPPYLHSEQLSIHGVGATFDKNSAKSRHAASVIEELEYQIPYLGAEEVIDEVILLLAHLENNRRETRIKAKEENKRVRTLMGKIDRLSKQRLVELPLAVQREHDACSRDINELNWHVSYRTRIEDRIKNKVAVAEVLNTRLKEDISFVQKHCPLVSEKLELEKEAMERIKQAQTDTNEDLTETSTQCGKIEAKSGEANAKADAERDHMKKDLEAVQDDLSDMSGELAEAKVLHNTYVHQCSSHREQVQSNDQELIVLRVKEENAKASEEMQATKVKDLQTRIVESEFEHRRLDNENQKLFNERSTNREKYTSQEEQMMITNEKKSDSLREIKLKNQELLMDIDDHHIKIDKCKKQKIADEKNLVRMDKEMERTEEALAQTTDDLGRVRVINSALHDKLTREEDRCAQEEESLRSTAEALRKQVKEEMHSRTVIQARISADDNELHKFKNEARIKKDKSARKAEEVSTLVKNVLDKVVRLRMANQDREKEQENLNGLLSNFRQKKKDIEEWNDTQRKEILPKHKHLKEEIMSQDKKLDHIHWKTEMMTKKIEEMDAAANMMSKSMLNSENAIKSLEANLEELNLRIKGALSTEDGLRQSLNEVVVRVREQDKNHHEHMEGREKVFAQLEKDLKDNLRLNKELASQYRQLQNEYFVHKNKAFDIYDHRVTLETSMKDLKKVGILQTRMHAALQEYHRIRSLYNNMELQRLDYESGQNAQHVTDLQGQMDSALAHIAEFLETQLDGTEAKRIAMEKVALEEKDETLVPQLAMEGATGTIFSSQTSVPVL